MKRFAGLLSRILCWGIASLPRRVQFLLGDGIGLVWFDVLRFRRSVVLNNMDKAFPEKTRQEKIRLGRKSLKHLGRDFVEYCRLPFLTEADLERDFEFQGEEYIKRAASRGRGVCLLTLHLGNGDLAIAGLALRGYPVHLISKEFKWRWLNDLWFGVRARLGTRFIPPKRSTYAVMKALKSGGHVIFVLDQFMGPPRGVKTHFFGHETGTAMGLAVIAHKTGAPVVPIFTYRRDDGTTVVRWEEEVPFESRDTKDETLVHMTQKYTDKVEELVRRCPEQWMWVHRRWKKFADHKNKRKRNYSA